MRLTRKYIMDNRTIRGAWTKPQIEALGLTWPPTKGWIDRVVGNDIDPICQRVFESRLSVKAYKKYLKNIASNPEKKQLSWARRKAEALAKHQANKQLDRELIVKQQQFE